MYIYIYIYIIPWRKGLLRFFSCLFTFSISADLLGRSDTANLSTCSKLTCLCLTPCEAK